MNATGSTTGIALPIKFVMTTWFKLYATQ